MTRAAIYVRISQDREQSALGVRRQEVDCRALADLRGWVVAGVYCDNDTSATSTRPRPEYERMLQDIRDKQIDAVVVWDVDRLTRKPRELEDIIDLADTHEIALASVGGEIDLSNMNGRFMARMKGNLARLEADQISRRAKAKQAELAASGAAHGGGTRPYGFEPDRVTHRSSEVAVLRDAADRLLNGETLVAICRDLTARGDLTATGRPWTSGSLRKALISPRVAGMRQHRNNPPVAAQWEPILDEETWTSLREALSASSRRTSTTSQRRHHWTGLLRCWRCGGLLGPRTIGGAESYACRRTRRNDGCGSTSVRKTFADSFLDEVLLRRIARLDLEEAGTGHLEVDERVEAAERAVATLETRTAELAAEFATGELDAVAFRLASREVLSRLRDAQENLREVRGREHRRASISVHPHDVADAWPAMSPRERRDIAGAFIDHVAVGPARRGLNLFDPNRLTVVWR